MHLPPAYQTGFQLKMLSLKTRCGNALSSTTHLVQKQNKTKQARKVWKENFPLLALKLSEALKCGDDAISPYPFWHQEPVLL